VAFADTLKTNTSVTVVDLRNNRIGNEGTAALAGGLKVNATVTSINLGGNEIGDEGASALANSLEVNTSVVNILVVGNMIDESKSVIVDQLVARNKRFRALFLFDARRMLLSVLCADECGVVWPYLLKKGDNAGVVVPDNVNALRAEFSAVIDERRHRATSAVQLVDAGADEDDSPAVKRRRTNQ
jgi:hypothetical protein